jgi:hypothetical protein
MFDRIFHTLLWFLPNLDGHLSDRQLADLFGRELSLLDSLAMRRHLARCAECRLRKQRLEGPRAERMLDIYRESIESPDRVLSEWPRTAFVMQLELLQWRDLSPHKWSSSAQVPWFTRLSSVLPVVLTGVFAGLVAGVSIFSFLSWERGSNITANALLVRAEKWDLPSSAARPGVAHQTVQIKSSNQTFKRTVYWDLQGKRRPKQTALSASEERVRAVLGPAGIDWNQPISASAYQDWHDRQRVRTDRITRSGAHLLTLTTALPDGIVSEESLTVRDTDFHPVQRRVDFRDHQMVEIAELDFKVLPWNAVDARVFEPEEGIAGSATDSSAGIVPSWRPLEAPTPEQLDETELSARLILNQRQADSGEQIEIHRLPEGVEVNGLVETDERKRELTAELTTVPRLKVSIQSAAHLSRTQSPDSETKSLHVETAVLADQPSPLEAYLRAHGQDLHNINAFAEKIFNSALAISQESRAIADLKTRFVPDKRMPVLTAATLADLLDSHRERLHNALREERALLSDVKASGSLGRGQPTAAAGSLPEEASRNLTLARELTQTGALKPRGAESIFAEMSATAERVAQAADQAYRVPQQAQESSMKKAGKIR